MTPEEALNELSGVVADFADLLIAHGRQLLKQTELLAADAA